MRRANRQPWRSFPDVSRLTASCVAVVGRRVHTEDLHGVESHQDPRGTTNAPTTTTSDVPGKQPQRARSSVPPARKRCSSTSLSSSSWMTRSSLSRRPHSSRQLPKSRAWNDFEPNLPVAFVGFLGATLLQNKTNLFCRT